MLWSAMRSVGSVHLIMVLNASFAHCFATHCFITVFCRFTGCFLHIICICQGQSLGAVGDFSTTVEVAAL